MHAHVQQQQHSCAQQAQCLDSKLPQLCRPNARTPCRGKGGLSKEDKDKLKLIGAVVAVGAAIAIGASKVHSLQQQGHGMAAALPA